MSNRYRHHVVGDVWINDNGMRILMEKCNFRRVFIHILHDGTVRIVTTNAEEFRNCARRYGYVRIT